MMLKSPPIDTVRHATSALYADRFSALAKVLLADQSIDARLIAKLLVQGERVQQQLTHNEARLSDR